MPLRANERMIVALDYPNAAGAVACVHALAGLDVAFKVGLELFVAEGPSVLQKVSEAGAARIFLDLKFHDIPNTMAGAVRSAVRSGVWMMNVHASAGKTALQASSEAAADEATKLGTARPVLIAVTVLTSISDDILKQDLSVSLSAEQQVARLAQIVREARLDGVVAPAPDAARIKQVCGSDFLIVSPGIRPEGTAVGDQKRIDTPTSAIRGGSDFLVVGRPITAAADPAVACAAIISEISAVS